MRQIRIAVICAASFALLCLLMFAFAPETGAAGPGANATSADGIWERIDNSAIAVTSLHMPAASPYQAVRLNKDALERQLARAPMEFTGDLRNSPAVLSLPMPDGSFQRFLIEESPVMDAALVAHYPEIKSYRGQGIEDGAATVRFDWTPLGFHAVVLPATGKAINIQPPNARDATTYACYYHERADFKCGVTEKSHPGAKQARAGLPHTAIGGTLRTERLAVAADWEFCNTIGGDTLAGTIAAINAYLNTIDAIYEKELSTHMNLVNAPNVIYASNNNVCGPGNNQACNAGNDPYTDSDESTMLTQVPPDLRDKVGSANYDVGHVIGTGAKGIAGQGVVCDNTGAAPRKGAGASRIFGPPGNSSASGLWAHELGHQHGASHTFNGTGDFCGPARNGPTAWEPGSGSTLMAYSVCAPDNLQSDDDNRLHNGSYNEMLTYLGASGGCATTTATGNSPPTVDAGTTKTIPKLTPFTLTATGTDPDASDIPNLRFIWEQFDAGGTLYANPPYGDQAGDPNTTTRPLFRCFSPVADKSRTFPSLTYILNNANVPPATIGGFQTAENLPAVSRTMNFRCTVRDQRGGVNDSSVAITVAGGAGPFAVTFPNGGETVSSPQQIQWNVAGTNAAPVNTANVKVSLSTDGGNTFPIVLTDSAPNTGMVGLNLPDGIITSSARIKVEAVGNIFFDISDGNFTLVPSDNCPAVSSIMPNLGNAGTVVTITGVNFTGVNAVKFAGAVATSFTVNSDTQITATVPGGAMDGPLVLSKPNCEDLQAGTFSVCSNPPTALSIDDGSRESVNQNGSGAYYVNRLTPASYPATLTQISIFWDPFQDFPPGTAINVVAGANPGGTTNIDGTGFQSFAATSGTSGFITYTLPNALTITAGDFVVGYQVPTQPANSFPVSTDTNNPASRSYVSNDGTTFTTITDRNYMIRAAQVYTGCSSGAPMPLQAVSRKPPGAISASRLIHAPNVVSFDVPLPLMGNPGIECRSGGATGDHQVVVTFPTNVTVNGSPQARVTIGTGQIGSGGEPNEGVVTVSGAVVTIPLTNVPNGHKIGVTLFGVSDGTNSGSVTVPMGVLLGDTTGNGTVNATDVSETKSKSGQSANASNFRDDVTVNGTINSTDVSTVKSKSGTALP